jgi:EcsC protein family
MELSAHDLADLKYAKRLLEKPGLGAKVINMFSFPIEHGFALLPAKWSEGIQFATRTVLETVLRVAVSTMKDSPEDKSSDRSHELAVAASGAASGAFGFLALPFELPVSISIMFRSIADIARSEGEQVKDPAVQLACMEVFALGGRATTDISTETGYFVIRAALASATAEAAEYIAKKGLAKEGAPVIVRFITQIAARFGITVSEKIVAQAIPLIGAVGGALINTMFIEHFQAMARGHFIVRRLERSYGQELVRASYMTC